MRNRATSKSNGSKGSYAGYVIGTYLTLALIGGTVSMNFMLSFGIFLSYHSWSCLWKWILLVSPNIYSVHVPASAVADWIPVPVPLGVELRRDRVVTSIAEISALRGSYMSVAFKVSNAVNSALAMIALHSDLHYRNRKFYQIRTGADLVPVCMLLFVVGTFLTEHFGDNKMDRYQTKMHTYGSYTLFASSLMIGFVTGWSVFALILIALFFGLAIYRIHWAERAEQNVSTDLATITMLSKKCIGNELLMYDAFFTILILTVNGSGANQGNIWSLF